MLSKAAMRRLRRRRQTSIVRVDASTLNLREGCAALLLRVQGGFRPIQLACLLVVGRQICHQAVGMVQRKGGERIARSEQAVSLGDLEAGPLRYQRPLWRQARPAQAPTTSTGTSFVEMYLRSEDYTGHARHVDVVGPGRD
eukprot:6207089-Pleurochrysis_carterae.AAC.1